MARYHGRIDDAIKVTAIVAGLREQRAGGIAMVSARTEPDGLPEATITLFYWDEGRQQVCAATIMGEAATGAYLEIVRPGRLDTDGRPAITDPEAWGRFAYLRDDGGRVIGRMYLATVTDDEARRMAGQVHRDLHICS